MAGIRSPDFLRAGLERPVHLIPNSEYPESTATGGATSAIVAAPVPLNRCPILHNHGLIENFAAGCARVHRRQPPKETSWSQYLRPASMGLVHSRYRSGADPAKTKWPYGDVRTNPGISIRSPVESRCATSAGSRTRRLLGTNASEFRLVGRKFRPLLRCNLRTAIRNPHCSACSVTIQLRWPETSKNPG